MRRRLPRSPWKRACAARRSAVVVGDEEACFYAFFGAFFHQTFNYVLERTQDVPWPLSARDGLAALLELLGSEPVYVRAALDGVWALGADGGLRLETAVEAFTAFLTPGYEALAEPGVSVFHGQLIGSSVLHVITRHALERPRRRTARGAARGARHRADSVLRRAGHRRTACHPLSRQARSV